MKIAIDGRTVEVAAGATILDAACAAGIAIPTLCHLPGRPAQTSCLVCVVRVDGAARLVPSCATLAREGMQVESGTPEVRAARRTALELLLGYHYGDCLAPCERICPTGYDVPELLRLAKDWHLDAARDVLLQRAALPGVLARLCDAPCERGCRRRQADGAVAVRAVERLVADADLAAGCPPPPCRTATGRRVAVVGAGAAGLSAAFQLRRSGHVCDLYDALPRPGGELLDQPEERLPAAVLAAEVGRILGMGVAFHGGAAADPEALLSAYDAVVLGAGSAPPRPGLVVAAARPGGSVVQAVAAGVQAAAAVDRLFAGITAPPDRPWSVSVGKVRPDDLTTMLACAVPCARHEPGPDGRLADAAAQDESARCLACSCSSRHDCALRRYGEEYGADPARFRAPLPPLTRDDSHPLVAYEPGKCIACGLCVQIAAEHGERLGLGFAGRGYAVQVAVPLGGCLRDALTTSAAACAAACPTGAIALKEAPCPP